LEKWLVDMPVHGEIWLRKVRNSILAVEAGISRTPEAFSLVELIK
jgi:hypothetical protein